MNNEEKKQDLTYDFDFESQVAKEEKNDSDNVEILTDSEVEEEKQQEKSDELEEMKEINETEIPIETLKETTNETLENVTNSEENKEEEKVKTIKILNKEFNFEDVVLILMGLIIVLSIFLLPRIMNIFS